MGQRLATAELDAKIGPTDRTLTRVQLGEWLDFPPRDELLDVVEAVLEPAR